MADITNLSFETVGASPGLAASWTLTTTSSVEEYAGFNSGTTEQAWEGFEVSWGADTWTLGLASTESVVFSTGLIVPAPAFETFTYGWQVDFWTAGLGETEAATFSSQAFEDFEEDWSNASWTLGLGSTTTALFGSGSATADTFESEWLNDTWSLTLVSTSAASFDGASPQLVEDFEQIFAALSVSIDAAADTVVAPAHGISNGTKVRYETDGTAAGGLDAGLSYFLVSTTTNTFQLARTSGGAAVAIDTQGSGAHTIKVDSTLYWNDLVEI